jgi:GcrA cell cycle regulator
MGWDDERVEKLKRLHAEGLSGAAIAEQLGRVTRNAVIGKIFRLGLSGRAPSTSAAARRRAGVRRAAVIRSGAKSLKASTIKRISPGDLVPKITPEEQAAIAASQAADVARVSFAELTDKQCKWPVGEVGAPGFGFCGDERVPGKSYCLAHTCRAYRNVNLPRVLADDPRGAEWVAAQPVNPDIAGNREDVAVKENA